MKKECHSTQVLLTPHSIYTHREGQLKRQNHRGNKEALEKERASRILDAQERQEEESGLLNNRSHQEISHRKNAATALDQAVTELLPGKILCKNTVAARAVL